MCASREGMVWLFGCRDVHSVRLRQGHCILLVKPVYFSPEACCGTWKHAGLLYCIKLPLALPR